MTPDDDALRVSLGRLDPAPLSCSVDPPTSLRAHELLERAMNATTHPAPDALTPPPRWRRPAVLAAAAAVVAIGVGAVLAGGGGGGAKAPVKGTSRIALQGQAGALSLGSCVPFSVEVLRDMPVAFAATATSVAPEGVTLSVDHWYKGGTADQVTVATPVTSDSPGEFVKGKHYLVTATEGTVNGCGYTGEATADLEKYFTQAFAP
jgi:hypothetical protein